MKTQPPLKQRGAASLFTALILLICITLVTFLTAKTVLVATQMTANNYRTAQAFAAANAAMDYALAYFGDPGNTTFRCAIANYPADFTQDHSYQSGANLPTTTASVCIDNTPPTNPPTPLTTPWGVEVNAQCLPCLRSDGSLASLGENCANPTQTTAGMIIATGWSDDGLAQRTITQCIGTRSLLAGNGPAQTLVSGSSVDVTGNSSVINRFNDLNIWSAEDVVIGSGAMETYIRPTDLEINELDYSQLTSTSTASDISQVVSTSGLGTGTDVYQKDGVLTAAKAATNADIADGGVGDGAGTFFDMFFPDIRKAEIASSAQASGQYYPDGVSDLDGTSGIIFVDGLTQINGGEIGTADSPVLLFIEGDLKLNGNPIIHGVIYVSGTIELSGGTANVIGSVISEGSVSGAGKLRLVYSPFGDGSGNGAVLPGLTGIIAGSWRDW